MSVKRLSYIIMSVAILAMPHSAEAQNDRQRIALSDSTSIKATEILTHQDSLKLMSADSKTAKKPRRDWATWRPEPKRALWLALVLPGAGQIYNRKFWKLPIVYGGIVGCVYAMTWNNQMYHDYSQAYMDIMDDDPNTASYNQFMHLGAQITSDNITTYQNLFKKRKDRFRRWRDMSFFVLVGVYALSVIDAYVDASLSEFDISNDLSLRVEPAIINTDNNRNILTSGGIGIHCSLNF
jgi:hypothetical protein